MSDGRGSRLCAADLENLSTMISQSMEISVKAFDLGFIPCKKVLDTMVLPFLKLVKKAERSSRDSSQPGSNLGQHVRDEIFSFWAAAFIQPLAWH